MLMIWHWIVHTMGVDETRKYGTWDWYYLWSGFASLTLLTTFLAAPVLLYRKHNCGIRWCWRLARHDYTDPVTGLTHNLCRKHHPDHPGSKPVTFAEFCRRHRIGLAHRAGRAS